ncbi:MAG: tRNA adenosine(34) deaminase TadA [Bacteroidota bacterium]|nr:tRNA adenosine(34) deaminase TadA [Bacteroidota bacterium]MDP4195941.1 tRNA adenosine(34) deaminase TadA [Bacteroidota bacterium]
MLFSEDTYRFMYAALSEAEQALEEDEIPIGAVVVHKNRIIGRGYNQTEKLKDPTAHAEMLAITAAANHLNDWRLSECDLYVTLEPCVMCTGAAIAARIRNIFFSIYEPKFGACGSLYNIAEEGKLNHKIKIFSGIYAEESTKLLKEFFSKTRNGNSK